MRAEEVIQKVSGICKDYGAKKLFYMVPEQKEQPESVAILILQCQE